MFFKSIDFPPELIQAHKEGKLVIFAGAGVSMPPPSDLPSFAGLAHQIGLGASPKQKDETEHSYLGRIHDDGRGVRVHDIATRLLLPPHSTPTPLHSLLLQLFSPKYPVRLVTTNFDDHFSTSAARLNIETPTYYAPALPLGDDFEGIVYLHGAAVRSPKNLVLTDSDFGRAYLTYGWATRFLYQLFSQYTVLFVGYSHNDVVMRYLARGLPPQSQSRRFAFSAKDTAGTWKPYGIRALQYDKKCGTNPHYPITESVSEWVDEIHRGLLERSQRIRSIVEAAPPSVGEDADYLEYALSDIDTARQFAKHAKRPEYIEWLDQRGFLKCFFNPHAVLLEPEIALLNWITSKMLVEHAHAVLDIFERNGPALHREFCFRVQHMLAYPRDRKSLGAIFAPWVTILLSQPHNSITKSSLSTLLPKYQWPDNTECALLLFQHLTMPRLLVERRFGLASTDTQDSVHFTVDLTKPVDYGLSKSWKAFFKPHIAVLARRIIPIVTANLQATYLLVQADRKEGSNFDALSFRRQTIRSSGPFPKLFDAIVDAGRDSLESMVISDVEHGQSIVEQWFSSGIPILQRLAVYGMTISEALTGDEKLQWLLDRDILFRLGFKAEVFDLIAVAYSSADVNLRRQLVSKVVIGPDDGIGRSSNDDSAEYESYNFLVWLNQTAPQCEEVLSALREAQAKHPDFRPREHPNLDYWFSEWKAAGDRSDIDDILQKPPGAFLDLIAATPADGPFGERRQDYVHAIMTLIVKNPHWGLALQNELFERREDDGQIWRQVFNGWREAKLTDAEWHKWFESLHQMTRIDLPIASGIAEVLSTKGGRSDFCIPVDLMEDAYGLSRRAWEAVNSDIAAERPEESDWLGLAINRPSGKLARFWLEYISFVRELAGEQWSGIPEPVRAHFELVIGGTSHSSTLARVVLASQLGYFFSLDPRFAEETILPTLDSAIDFERAKQCWAGFLGWGRWWKSFLGSVLPLYEKALAFLGAMPVTIRDAFVAHIVGIAILGLDDALRDGWLLRFIRSFDSAMRSEFSKLAKDYLEEMQSDLIADLWRRWLRRYWDDRILGIPLPLGNEELLFIARWPLYLGSDFAEAVDLLKRSPRLVSLDPLFDDEIGRLKHLASSQPESTADYLVVLLRGHNALHDEDAIRLVVDVLRAMNVQARKISDIEDELIRLRS